MESEGTATLIVRDTESLWRETCKIKDDGQWKKERIPDCLLLISLHFVVLVHHRTDKVNMCQFSL